MIFFENNATRAAFYFAAEEWIMRVLRPSEAVLMLWTTDDTVMLGANQVADAECDTAYMKSNGITLVRRPSGGGAIYTDRGTLQFTVILPHQSAGDAGTFVRDWLAEPVIEAIAHCGAAALLRGRNDIVIGDQKISGIAQYIKSGYLCSHGSLLFRTDLKRLSRTLTVDPEKIKSKGVQSVAARVTNIADHSTEQDITRFRNCLAESFGQGGRLPRRTFDAQALLEIESDARERYENAAWTYGRDPGYTKKNKRRFPGGSLEIALDIKSGVIQAAKITGDFLALRPVTPLEDALTGIPYRADDVRRALSGVEVAAYLGSLALPELLEVIGSA